MRIQPGIFTAAILLVVGSISFAFPTHAWTYEQQSSPYVDIVGSINNQPVVSFTSIPGWESLYTSHDFSNQKPAQQAKAKKLAKEFSVDLNKQRVIDCNLKPGKTIKINCETPPLNNRQLRKYTKLFNSYF